jgi:methylated-DNA-[protein]-cysteine S-methyltransferase
MTSSTAPAEPAPAGTSSERRLRHTTLDTPLGRYVLAAESTTDDAPDRPDAQESHDALIGVWRADQQYFPGADRLGSVAAEDDALLAEASTQLLDYLEGRRQGFDLPLRPAGTAFQHAVWDALRTIPFGATTTYGALAQQMGRPRAAQAVGRAVGTNPLSIVVPCHRVLGADGSLTGYAGGLGTKQALLRLEGVLP